MTEAKTFCKEMWQRFWASASDEMKAAIVAGIPLDWKVTSTSEGMRLTATTKYPIALVDHGDGKTLYYKVPEQ